MKTKSFERKECHGISYYSDHETSDEIREHNKKFEKCSYKKYAPDGRQYSCRSQKCRNELCRKKHAEKESLILEYSLTKRPCQFAFNLKITDRSPITDAEMSKYLSEFNEAIKYQRKKEKITIEYDLRIEFTNRKPHLHGSLIIDKEISQKKCHDLLRQAWQKACGIRQTRVYCKPTKNQVGNARYVTKNIKDRTKVEKIPKDWDTKICKINRSSRNFYVYSKEAIWNIWCDFFAICRTGLNLSQKGWYYNETIDWLKARVVTLKRFWLNDFIVPLDVDEKPTTSSVVLNCLNKIIEKPKKFISAAFKMLFNGSWQLFTRPFSLLAWNRWQQ